MCDTETGMCPGKSRAAGDARTLTTRVQLLWTHKFPGSRPRPPVSCRHPRLGDTEPQRGRVMLRVSHGWLPNHVGEGRHVDRGEYSP